MAPDTAPAAGREVLLRERGRLPRLAGACPLLVHRSCRDLLGLALRRATLEERALALHDARRATKRARYAVEPLRPVYGEPAAELTTRLKTLQTALGEHQDTVVTRVYLHALVQDTHPPLDPAAALTAGALIERESRAAEEYDLQAEAAWRKVAGSPRLG